MSQHVGRKTFTMGYNLYNERRYIEAEQFLRQAAERQERKLGRDHENTLDSKHWLGRSLYEQEKYSEAERQFRQAAEGREKRLGRDHKNTLCSKHNLGLSLYEQKKHSEAERLLGQAAEGSEKTLGRDHENTLYSKNWLGFSLYDRKKFSEAERLLGQAAEGSEKTLGRDHENTLYSKNWLGLSLYYQKKYSEAERLLRQVAEGREKTLGRDHENTLDSKHWLGRSLYDQKKYSKAERLLRQAAEGREKTLGRDHENTLDSKHWLGISLSEQKKYSEAERQFRQAAEGSEKTLGRDHKNTLYSKHNLGLSLYDQKKYSEAERQFRQAAEGSEKTLGRDHGNILDNKHWLGQSLYEPKGYGEGEQLLEQVADRGLGTLGDDHDDILATLRWSREMRPKPTQNAFAVRLDSFFSNDQTCRETYCDSEIIEISTLLKHLEPQHSELPRTYIVLRTIGHQSLLGNLLKEGFSDYLFPVTERTIPKCVQGSNVRAAFLDAQRLVLTKALDLENGQHCYFEQEDSLPFETKGVLGRGGYGQVDKVFSLTSFKEYARKRVLRSDAFKRRGTRDMTLFIDEIKILKRIDYHHIVKFVGSYTDPKYISLIMDPVAEMDLDSYLKRVTISKHPELRTFFGCLASALKYLHEHKIRHKDIKPRNILVDRGNVLFTDFGLSFDFMDADDSTTVSIMNGLTSRYCAPEVAQHEPRNTMSDIWSLGVVFMEMIVTLKGRTVQHMNEFFRQHGSQGEYIRTNPTAFKEFVTELEGIDEVLDNQALGWTKQMLSTERQSRPTASSLFASIVASGEEGERADFYGICCVPFEDNFSDYGMN